MLPRFLLFFYGLRLTVITGQLPSMRLDTVDTATGYFFFLPRSAATNHLLQLF